MSGICGGFLRCRPENESLDYKHVFELDGEADLL
jgi:hypothetical protein